MLDNDYRKMYYVRKLEKGADLSVMQQELEQKRRKEEEIFWKAVTDSFQRLNNALSSASFSK
ncbi:hypothetical protein CGH51_22845 [Vibrio parahaemolyticus]|uniref:hypothetical protein n=1 Tax=Vibrio parahaemolyticus TaxID=670 RepID=UPI00111D0DB9|nr:hypothetical protein [Vibrio parahaemolyticus]TON66168.1 hypothetical protein CGH51_22845 [Vibrio parahaemolyticus]